MESRPVIVSLEDTSDEVGARVVVTLSWDDRSTRGEAVGPAGQRPRLAGEATLDAMTVLIGDARFELLAVAATDLGSESVALAQVRDADGHVLVGSALERETDPGLAVARAVMDAINRRLGSRPDAGGSVGG